MRRAGGAGESRGQRLILASRLILMLGAPTPFLFGFAPGTTDPQRWSYAVGLLLFELGGLVVLRRWKRREPAGLAFLTSLALVDVVALTTMGLVASPAVSDPLYPAFVILPVLYALLLPKRRALAVGGTAGIAYALSVAGHQSWEYYHLLVYVERIAAIPLVTWIVAAGAEMQRRQVERLELLSGVTEAVHSSLDDEFLTEETVRTLAQVLGVRAWRLCVVDGLTRRLEFEAAAGPDGFHTRTHPVPVRACGPRGASGGPTFEPGAGNGVLRLLVHDDAEVVFCADEGELGSLPVEDRIVLHAVAREVLVAIENRRLYGITKHLAVTDALTGLYNRRHLSRRLLEEIGRARRFGGSVSLLMLDGDDFKRVNDRHGHRTGDEVLIQLGELMLASVRDMDVIARYGGEEFCILLPETDAAGAVLVAEKLCQTVRSYEFVKEVALTVSIGVATFPDDADTAEYLQQAADRALYRAKADGKCRVHAEQTRQDFAS